MSESRHAAPGAVASSVAERTDRAGVVPLAAEPRAEQLDEERRPSRAGRLRSLDAVRGLAIVVMLLAGNPFPREHILVQLTHPEWHGLRFADLFFPLFLFAMGVSMTLSQRAGSPRLVLRRVALLLLLGVALASLKHEGLAITGVLQHIAGAYLVAWLVLKAPRKLQAAIAGAILAAVWAGFLLWGGEADPWGQRGTFAHAVNGWLLGGFATEGVLQTVTSGVTVVGGALIGRGIQGHPDPAVLLRWVGRRAVWLIVLGLLLALVVPINKRLWTPSFTVLTIGTSAAWLTLFVWLADLRRYRFLVTPLQELGGNPIAVYVVFMAARALLDDYRELWPSFALLGSDTAGTLVYGLAWTALTWLFARALFRRQIFFKI